MGGHTIKSYSLRSKQIHHSHPASLSLFASIVRAPFQLAIEVSNHLVRMLQQVIIPTKQATWVVINAQHHHLMS